MIKLAVIGGTGLENPDILKNPEKRSMETPYGISESDFVEGLIGNMPVVIVSRHGKHHHIPPAKVNNRANLWALKELGCTHIVATTACGSLHQPIERGHLIFPDQFIDFTRHRAITFFDEFKDGNLNHAPMADPFNNQLRKLLIETAREMNIKFHEKGTVVTIEGPRFSTRAESHMFRAWGAHIINMSTAPEVILANELKIPYAAIAMSTDYDCWKEDEEPVTWEDVLQTFKNNADNVIDLLIRFMGKIQ